MKKCWMVLCSLLAMYVIHGQAALTDSLSKKLATARPDTSKVFLLTTLSDKTVNTDPLKALQYAEDAILLAKGLKCDTGVIRALYQLGVALFINGNFSRAMKVSLEGLNLAEKKNDEFNMASLCMVIGNIYRRQGNNKSALAYYVRASNMPQQVSDENFSELLLSNLGAAYFNLNQTDSAMYYLQSAYQKSTHLKQSDQSIIYNQLGDLYYRLKKIPLALEYYRMGAANAQENDNRRSLCFNYVSIAELFGNENRIDSSLIYGRKALAVAQNRFYLQQLRATTILSEDYAKTKNPDSSLKYLRSAMMVKDTMQSKQEEAEIQSLLFEDQLHQKEIEEEREKQKIERTHDLQYAAIAFAVVVLLIAFLVLSHSVIANQKLIKFLGVVSLLIIFEFLNLLLHPWLGELTHHSPVLMLLIMVCVAALLVPMHHRLEHWITHKLVEKNNEIRLTAAKKTIEKLEGTINAGIIKNGTDF